MTYVDVVRFFERNCFFFFFANGGYESDFPYIFFFPFYYDIFPEYFFPCSLLYCPQFQNFTTKKKSKHFKEMWYSLLTHTPSPDVSVGPD